MQGVLCFIFLYSETELCYRFRDAQTHLLKHYVATNIVAIPTAPQSAQNTKRNVVTMAEPLMINPNSYANVTEVLKTIQSNAPTNKCWSAVGSDGVPYVLGQKLRDDPKNKLSNLLLLPGPGHFEINTIKVLFRLLWPVGMEKLASLTGFRTAKALQYALKASDHHKSWELLSIFFKATIAIHLETFIAQKETSDKAHLTLEMFEQWVANSDDFHKYINVMCFRYILALFLYRQGIRMNCSHLALSGRILMGELYYSNHMIGYMDIHYRDLITRIKAPPQVRSFLEHNESFCESGNAAKHEGGDFVLENRNRRTKMFAPPGIPSPAQWQRICRLLDGLMEVIQYNSMT